MTTGPGREQPIARDVLLDARLGQAKETHRVEVRRIRIIPGHAAGPHVHNGSVVGSIVEGSAVFQVDGEPETVLRPGDVFFEPEGARRPGELCDRRLACQEVKTSRIDGLPQVSEWLTRR